MSTVATRAPRTVAAPFRGLAPFGDGELDALLFFGREHETEIAVANLLASRLTILYGPSGVGKTSLLRAGVTRRVRELADRRALGRGPDAAVVVFSGWSGSPVRDLAAAVAAETTALVRAAVPPPDPDASLADVVEHWATVLDGDLFLVLDQLEEHFLYHAGERGAGTLVDELPEVILRPRLRAHVLLSLRDDALAQLDVLKDRVPALYGNVLRLDRLDRAAATAAILGPVRRFSELVPPGQRVEVEPALVDAVLAEAVVPGEDERIEPPYLQLVMERLWDEEELRDARVLRASTLEELGGARSIVRDHLGRALAALSPRQQDAVAAMFVHLVTPSGTKLVHRAADLAQFASLPPAEAGEVLAILGRQRILRAVDAGDDAGARYEIFHDVLGSAILGWRRRRELEHANAAARRHQRRLVAVAAVSLLAVLVMLGITLYALDKRSLARTQSREAEARALAATALTDLDRTPGTSLLLARRAASLSSSPLVEDVLRTAILASRVRRIVPLGTAGVGAAFGPGGAVVAVSVNGHVEVADAASGRILRAFDVAGRRFLLARSGTAVLAYGTGAQPRLAALPGGHVSVLPTRPVHLGAFSDDGRRVATSDVGPYVKIWDVATGAIVRTLRSESPPTVLALSRDGTRLALGAARTVEVYDVDSGAVLARLSPPSEIRRIAFSAGGHVLALAGADHTVRVQEVDTRRLLAVDEISDDGAATGLAFSPRGSLLAVSYTDGNARVWRLGGTLVSLLIGHRLDVTGVSFSADGARIVTTSKDGTARVWHAESGDPVALLAGHGEPVASAAFSPDGRSVVTVGGDGTMRLWDALAEPELVLRERLAPPVSAVRATRDGVAVAPAGAADVSISAAGDRVATVVGRRVEIRPAGSTKTLASFAVPDPAGGVALSPDGGTVAVTGRGVARLYDLEGRLLRVLRHGSSPLTRIAFSSDGRRLAAGSEDHTAVVWRVASGGSVVLRGHTDTVASARFSGDGRLLVTASRDHLTIVWDALTGRRLRTLRGHFGAVADAAFSPDGRWIVTAGPGKAGLWDARSAKLLFYLQGHAGPLTSASFAADGRTILTSGQDGTVRSYRCDVCTGLAGLRPLADARIAASRSSAPARSPSR